MAIIKPTVGRVVLYYSSSVAREQAALVACVQNDSIVNLTVLAFDGSTFGMTNVPLVQAGETRPAGSHCMWMPYQLGQAARTEAAESKKS